MKALKIFTAIVFSIAILNAQAQNEIPKGYEKGKVVLSDNSVVTGYIKEKIRKDASLTLIAGDNSKKTSFEGSDLVAAEIGDDKFLCFKGDFFKVICSGELEFLQKSSDASGKLSYNGAEAAFNSGTEGSPGDYFIFNKGNKELKLVSKKNFDKVVAIAFEGYTAAMEKAKTVNGDIAQLKEAVDLYNNRNNR